MSPKQIDRVKSIFLRAAEVEAALRPALLAQECANEPEVREKVERLLRNHDETATTDLLGNRTMSNAPRSLADGDRIAERFRIVGFIGKGGMGEVYEAQDEELGGRIALKIILPNLLQDQQFLARFRREVHLARLVTHPNVCRMFDVGRAKIGERELVFLTMEFVPGETLADQLRRQGRMQPEEALVLLEQMAAGLGALHEQSIVHRDFKPANVLIMRTASGGPRAVLGDFGLARAAADTALEDELSRSGLILGTPGYMAPEQMMGQKVTPATDVYSFGVVLYEMVTGRKVSAGGGIAVKVVKPREHVPELPVEWETAILRCLEREPADRPASLREVVEALAGVSRLKAIKKNDTPRWPLVLAGVAVLGAGVYFTPLRHSLVGGQAGISRQANEEYLQARELLDRSYRSDAVPKAVALLEKAIATDPNSAVAHAALGRAYWAQYRSWGGAATLIDKAKAECSRALELDKDAAPAHVILGRIYTHTGRPELAAQELQAALRLDARNADAYSAMADLYRAQGRLGEVEPALQKAVDLAPDVWRHAATLGLYYRDSGRLDDGEKTLRRVTEMTPDNPKAYGYLGVTFMRRQKFGEATAAFQKEIALEPSATAYSNLGAVFQLEGNFAEAARNFQRAIDLEPGDYTYWGNMGSAYVWSAAPKDKVVAALRKAVELAEQRRTENPNDARLISSLAGYYAVLGEAAKSEVLLRKAAALEPDYPAVAYRIGETYELLHRREEALRWIASALRLGYSAEYVKRSPELAQLRADSRFQWQQK